MKFSLYIDDIEYEITGTFTPGDPGRTSGPSEYCYHPTDDEFEIETVKIDGVEIQCPSARLLEQLAEKALEKAAEIYDDDDLELT